jgi:hypothetical protein
LFAPVIAMTVVLVVGNIADVWCGGGMSVVV